MAMLAVFLSGLLFAVGLGIAGMTLPQKVQSFFDVLGAWDPSLALVMVGSAGTYLVLHRWVLKRGTPVFGTGFSLPTRNDIDPPLVIGAALFGIGWGLVGLCPGPALTALVSGAPGTLVFFVAMIAGMLLKRGFDTLGQDREDSGASLLDRLRHRR